MSIVGDTRTSTIIDKRNFQSRFFTRANNELSSTLLYHGRMWFNSNPNTRENYSQDVSLHVPLLVIHIMKFSSHDRTFGIEILKCIH